MGENCGNCHRCVKEAKKGLVGIEAVLHKMLLCSVCGSKRCQKVSDHRLDCLPPGQCSTTSATRSAP